MPEVYTPSLRLCWLLPTAGAESVGRGRPRSTGRINDQTMAHGVSGVLVP